MLSLLTFTYTSWLCKQDGVVIKSSDFQSSQPLAHIVHDTPVAICSLSGVWHDVFHTVSLYLVQFMSINFLCLKHKRNCNGCKKINVIVHICACMHNYVL